MKRVIINILSTLFQWTDTILCRLHLKRPKVIVFMEGGICSQMQMYLCGQYYTDYGFDVYYDTLWFKKHGKDQYCNMPRLLELTDMWPLLSFKTPSAWQRKFYLIFFKAPRIDADWLPAPSSIHHSIYLEGFWDIKLEERKVLFEHYFDLSNARTPEISIDVNAQTAGVHVRRGDLAKGDNPYYGGVSDGYFLHAIDFCNTKFKPSKYIFFSDEPDWVEQNVCNLLTHPYEVIRGNKAWEDLWLLSHCAVIIASQGSFGKVAALLNPSAVLIQCDNKYANHNRLNTYYIR